MKPKIFNLCGLLLVLLPLVAKSQVVLKALEGGVTYTSTQTRSYSRSFTRNNCSSGYYGTSVTYSRSATATATSTVSQADADQKAANQAYADAQSLVNNNGQASGGR